MKITYRQAAREDMTRQFRYYLVTLDRPEVAVRFREAVRTTAKAISARPLIAPRYLLGNSRLRDLRSWPVIGFGTLRLYFLVHNDAMQVIRILHGKRDIRKILEREQPSEG